MGSTTCPQCGTVNPAGAHFCRGCGLNLTQNPRQSGALHQPAPGPTPPATPGAGGTPTVVHGGVKTNVIPDSVDLEVDIRTLPGQSPQDVHAMLREAVGDLADEVEITPLSDDLASTSEIDTPLWESLTKATTALVPGSETIPFMLVGATDARFFRRAGSVAYGYGLFSERISFADYATMFHGDNERIDLESLDLVTRLWEMVLGDFLG